MRIEAGCCQVYLAPDPINAEIVKDLLVDHGHEAYVRRAYLWGGVGELPANVYPSVWVPLATAEAARKAAEEAVTVAKTAVAETTARMKTAELAKQESDKAVTVAVAKVTAAASIGTPQVLIEELYISCLSRKPLEKEMAAFTAILEEDKENTTQVLEDIFWSLLNSREFIFNH